MSMGGGTPKQPDYVAAANAEAQGNLDLARYATQANRVNQYTPWGSSTWTNDRAFDQAGYDAATARYNQQATAASQAPRSPLGLGTAMGGGYDFNQSLGTYVDQGQGSPGYSSAWNNLTMPNPEDFYTGGDNWSQNIQLSPEMQQMLDQQNRIQLGLFGAQNNALDRVNSMMGTSFDTSGLPSGGSALNMSSLPGLGDVFDPNRLSAMGSVLDINGLPSMGTVLDINGLPTAGTAFGGSRGDISMYDPTLNTNNATDLLMQRINPQLDQQQEALRARLAQQGVVEGSEAYNRALMQHQQGRNDAYNQAALTGIGLGMQQQGLQFNQGLQNRQLTAAEQAQQFQQQGYLRELAAALQQQQYGQQTNNRQMSAAEQAQLYGQMTNNRMLGSAEQAQRYAQQTGNQQLAAALQQQQFNQAEQARQRAYQEAAYARGLPFQELSALTSGSQVQMPQFPGYSQQATTGGANLLGATQMGYQSALGAANASNAANANMMGGLFSLGGQMIGGPAGGALGGLFGGLFG